MDPQGTSTGLRMKRMNIEIKAVPSLQRMLSWFICSVNSFSAIVSVRGTESEKRLLKFFILFISLDQNSCGDAWAVWRIVSCFVFWNINVFHFAVHIKAGVQTQLMMLACCVVGIAFSVASLQNPIKFNWSGDMALFVTFIEICFFIKAAKTLSSRQIALCS